MGNRTFKKLIGGVRLVGPSALMDGSLRLARLRLQRPRDDFVVTRADNLIIHFRYPQQLVGTLVLFRELVEPEYDLVARLLTAQSIFFDVGAGIGAYSLTAAVRPVKMIHAFEPLPLNVETIKRNLRANGCEARVVLNPCALSDSEGCGQMRTPSVGDVFASALERMPSVRRCGSVRVTTLDAYCRSGGVDRIDLLKIDVEGHEASVLAGAEELLERNRIGVMVLETDPGQVCFYQSLSDRGFTFFYYDPQQQQLLPIRPITKENLESLEPTPFSSNIVVIHADRISEVLARLARPQTCRDRRDHGGTGPRE